MTALLLTTAACGEDGGTGSAEGNPLSKAQLSDAVLTTQRDLPGYAIREVSGSGAEGSARAIKKVCQPIIDVTQPGATAYQKRLIMRSIAKKPTGSRNPAAVYLLALLSTESEAAAEEFVKDLKSAINACDSGFRTTSTGIHNKIRSVTANKVRFGEGGVDFSLEYRTGVKIRYVVVQDGAALTNISAQDQFAHTYMPVPEEIVDAQRRRLEKVTG
ncbi:hypothetical protein [Streptomyces alboniger]|uniref:hypothetical protein n=1 Tax=Streptomyces alboniger TaxID=132473 RepID=UPI00123D2DFC|nr:hypothetical protein [Streptomyces alboniger]